jgi:uncharacterized membrane protein (UPF0127 family)
VRRLAVVVSVLLGCGCPAKSPPAPPQATTKPEAPSPKPTPPPPPLPPVESPGPSGPSGPAGPASAESRTPAPEDGKHQLDLRRKTTLTINGEKVEAWVADGPHSRRLGLMHVRKMPADAGMIFAYPDVKRRSFWMRNTFIPLSLAYISADGRIEQILDMAPLTTESHPSKAAVMYVLEMNKGWFERKGIRPGMKVEGVTELRGF